MTRQEHLDWAKARALEYIDRGDCLEGITSMCSDLTKHEELKNHKGIQLAMGFLMIGKLRTVKEARRFIEGFH